MFSYNIIDKNFEKLLALDLKETFTNKKLIFFCVGCDKWTIDCFGPILGTILKKKYKINSLVFGELNNCITKNNYIEFYQSLRNKFPDHKIIVIDTALCDYDNIGVVRFNNDGLAIGSGLHDDCTLKIGDYYITANIGILPFGKNNILPMPALGKVYLFAQKISRAIIYALS